MPDYTKNHLTLYTHYRNASGEFPEALIDPEHHILYLDLLSVMTFSLPYSLDQIRRALNSPDREVSRRDVLRHLGRLKAIGLISADDLSTVSFAAPFRVTVNEPYTAEELRAGKHQE